MKKRLMSLAFSLILLISMLVPAHAAAPTLVAALKLGSAWCVIGTETTQVDPGNPSVVPVAESGRILLPIRRILEAFGGSAEWRAPNGVTCTLGGVEVALMVGEKTAEVNGKTVALDVPARAENGRTFVPVRFVTESLGLQVEYDAAHQIVVVADGVLDKDGLAELPQVKALIEKTTPKPGSDPIGYAASSYSLPSGTVSAGVLTVDMNDPRVSVKAALPDGKLNRTRSFASIAADSGAVAVVNANFFNSYDQIKDPVGQIMADGEFLFCSSGGNSLGITADNQMRYGHPAVFLYIRTADGGSAQVWSVFEVNVLEQMADQAVLYTPARGDSFPVTYPGYVLVAAGNTSSDYRAVSVGETVSIPQDGFVAYFSQETASTEWHVTPELGRKLEIEPYLFTEDDEGFTLDGVRTIVGGGPRLVKDGAVFTELEGDFAYDKRFQGSYAAPRTAVGTTSDNKLLLVTVSSATIQQMRELMSVLGCVDAFNLDGGGSTAMYYKGQVLASPGRELTATLQIFVDE